MLCGAVVVLCAWERDANNILLLAAADDDDDVVVVVDVVVDSVPHCPPRGWSVKLVVFIVFRFLLFCFFRRQMPETRSSLHCRVIIYIPDDGWMHAWMDGCWCLHR